MVRRGNAVPDADCPTSVADLGYWVVTSRTRTDKESLERSTELEAEINTQDAIGVLTGLEGRLDQLHGVGLNADQSPAAGDLLKFVRDSASTGIEGAGAGFCV